MKGVQCDGPGCRKFSADPARWLILARQPGETSFYAAITGDAHDPLIGTFCSARRLAEYAYVMAVAAEPALGVEMPPSPRIVPPAPPPSSWRWRLGGEEGPTP